MELNIEDFFDILFDQNPHFEYEFEDVLDSEDKLINVISILIYRQFNNHKKFKTALFSNGRRIIRQFKSDYSSKKISRGFLQGYLDDLKKDKSNFQEFEITGVNNPIHKNSYVTSYYNNPFAVGDNILPLEKIKKDRHILEEFIAYNRIHYETLELMETEIESILLSSDVIFTDSKIPVHSEKLELNKSSLSDIVLLFRLLEENKVFTAKHKTHIFRVIQSSFKAINNTTFNEGSIKNAFNEPDPNSVKNIEMLIANMKISLKKY